MSVESEKKRSCGVLRESNDENVSGGAVTEEMQCVWKEGGCELNPLHNMWLLGT